MIFCSSLEGWSFTLHDFARMYATKFGINREHIQQKLWGSHYYNHVTRKFQQSPADDAERSFCKFVLRPILQVKQACHEKQNLDKYLYELDIHVSLASISSENVYHVIMKQWLPFEVKSYYSEEISIAKLALQLKVLHNSMILPFLGIDFICCHQSRASSFHCSTIQNVIVSSSCSFSSSSSSQDQISNNTCCSPTGLVIAVMTSSGQQVRSCHVIDCTAFQVCTLLRNN